MTDAPQAAREVAEALNNAFPGLGESQICYSSEGDDGGEVIVIGSPARLHETPQRTHQETAMGGGVRERALHACMKEELKGLGDADCGA